MIAKAFYQVFGAPEHMSDDSPRKGVFSALRLTLEICRRLRWDKAF